MQRQRDGLANGILIQFQECNFMDRSGSLSADKDRRLESQGRTSDMRTELGGCCVRGVFSPAVPHVFSRTEHIMSRYRPIAPKPMVMKPGESAGSAASDPQSSSTLSFERTSTKATSISSDSSRGKRSRKRAGTYSLPSPRVSKRTPLLPNSRADRGRTVTCKSIAVIGGIEKAVEQFSPDNGAHAGPSGGPGGLRGGLVTVKGSPSATYLTEMAPTDTRPMFAIPGNARFDREKYGSSFGAIGRRNPRPQLILDSRVGSVGIDVTSRIDTSAERCVPSIPPVERESAFMERAAASAPAFCGRRGNGFQKASGYLGDNRHHLRVDSSSLTQAYASGTAESLVDASRCSPMMEGAVFAAHPSISNSYDESEVTSGDVAESRRTNLVTLSLLPDTPSLEQTCSEVSTPNSNLPCLRLGMGVDPGNWDTDGQNEGTEGLHKLTLFSSPAPGAGAEDEAKRKSSVQEEKERESSWGRSSYASDAYPVEGRPLLETLDKDMSASSGWDVEEKNESGRLRVIDVSYMEQVYWSSSDPVLLTDDENKVLWSNQAFRRANTERTSGKDKEVVGPYIDPLGIPTQLSSFVYQVPQGPKVRAVLWGFLKKFIMLETSGGSLLSEERDLEYRNAVIERKFLPNMKDEVAELGAANQHTVIAPQPIRPVGSSLRVGSITRNNFAASPITDSLESVKEKLDGGSMPAIITDYRDRVRYMNAAYKQMVGQPECPWLSTVGKKTVRDNAQHSRLTGEVMLTCKENLQQLAASFSCRVLVQWINQGKENWMTVPCEVSRLENDSVGTMYVWKLDVSTSSFRPVGGGLRQDCAQGK